MSNKKEMGILCPISSLPNKYGIGAFDEAAYTLVDNQYKAGSHRWQVLPLFQTGYGDSPYSGNTTFGGNPYFISIDELIAKGYLTKEEVDELTYEDNRRNINYGLVYTTRQILLPKAYSEARDKYDILDNEEFKEFVEKEDSWLQDYALFKAIKDYFNGANWLTWPEDIKRREPAAVKRYTELLADEINFQKFLQFEFDMQWMRLKAYANAKGIKIVGDLPIYVAQDSADVWANTRIFKFDMETYTQLESAGCPPDAFSKDGQLWGLPVYDWDYIKTTNYKWWIERIQRCDYLYDIIRLDHFRGFGDYYSVASTETTAVNGTWHKGPGMDLFRAIDKALGKKVEYIAEDLGILSDTARQFINESKIPGMHVLQFELNGSYNPSNYTTENTVIYTGTHDNDTTISWYNSLPHHERQRVFDTVHATNWWNPVYDIIRFALNTEANLVIIPINDVFTQGGDCRINTPGTADGNWQYRLFQEELENEQVALEIKKLVCEAGRYEM